MVIVTLARLLLLLLLQQPEVSGSEYVCGFPGEPALGFVKPYADAYEEGAVVKYSCMGGHVLLGKSIRRCKEDGTWTDQIPICDDSMGTAELTTAHSTPAIAGHPPDLAIDKDRDTCTYLSPRNPRWWRMDLGGFHKVLSVAVTMASFDKVVKFTVHVIEVQGTNALYHRCGSFTGRFGTSTILLTCAEGKGIKGHRVHIEDHFDTDGLFELCEVEVQIEKDTGYDCGKPDRHLNSITFKPENKEVDYGCNTGYELIGRQTRQCLNTGQWDGEAPICKAIICQPLPELENGEMKLRLVNGDSPLEGTIANYRCNKGYRLIGDFIRECQTDGSWSGKDPHCEVIRCKSLDGRDLGGFYRLMNKTTRVGSMAILKCRKGKMEGDDPYITCTEEGEWTESHARCLIPAKSVVASSEGPRIVNKGAIIFGMVVAAVMVAIVLVSLYVVFQRRRNANKPELPARQSGAPEAPPRPPPRGKMPFTSALMGYMSRDSKPSKTDSDVEKNESFWKTRSLPMKAEENRDWQADATPNRASSLDQPFYTKAAEEKEVSEPEATSPEPEDEPEISKIQTDETAVDENANEEASDAGDEQEETAELPAEAPTGREYAAVDYEKKRASRLKGQKSEEDKEAATEQETQENDESASPEVPPKSADLADEEMVSETTDKETAEEEPAAAVKPPTPEPEEKPKAEESASTGRKRTRARAEPEEPAPDKSTQPRRMRWRAEQAEEPEEPKVTRGTRRLRDREK